MNNSKPQITQITQMNSDDNLYKQDTYNIIGCAMQVHKTLGHGLPEKVYEKSLAIEFKHKNIPYSQQEQFNILYRNENVGIYIPDLIVDRKIVVELKTIDKITNNEIGQVITYLKITKYKLGLILNFKNQSLEWKRVVLKNT